jgi:hypothetical protein
MAIALVKLKEEIIMKHSILLTSVATAAALMGSVALASDGPADRTINPTTDEPTASEKYGDRNNAVKSNLKDGEAAGEGPAGLTTGSITDEPANKASMADGDEKITGAKDGDSVGEGPAGRTSGAPTDEPKQ